MKFVNLQLPSLLKLKMPIPIVADDESGIRNAIDKCLSGVHHLQCLLTPWLQSHGATPVCVS